MDLRYADGIQYNPIVLSDLHNSTRDLISDVICNMLCRNLSEFLFFLLDPQVWPPRHTTYNPCYVQETFQNMCSTGMRLCCSLIHIYVVAVALHTRSTNARPVYWMNPPASKSKPLNLFPFKQQTLGEIRPENRYQFGVKQYAWRRDKICQILLRSSGDRYASQIKRNNTSRGAS